MCFLPAARAHRTPLCGLHAFWIWSHTGIPQCGQTCIATGLSHPLLHMGIPQCGQSAYGLSAALPISTRLSGTLGLVPVLAVLRLEPQCEDFPDSVVVQPPR